MSPESLFAIVNPIALLSWLLLAIAPRRPWVTGIVAGTVVPVLFAVAYVTILVTAWPGSPGGFSTLAAVAQLFANPWLLLAGWIHYLCFDLLVGCAEVRDAQARGIPHLLIVPCLALTFLFGPAGWLLYRGIAAAYRARPA
jgi:hypothetical protein